MKYLHNMIASAIVTKSVFGLKGNDGTCFIEDCKAYSDDTCTTAIPNVPWQYMQNGADTMNTAIHRTYPWNKCIGNIQFACENSSWQFKLFEDDDCQDIIMDPVVPNQGCWKYGWET